MKKVYMIRWLLSDSSVTDNLETVNENTAMCRVKIERHVSFGSGGGE